MARPSISVKLSAIHPRFDPGKETLLHAELPAARRRSWRAAARMRGLGLTIDAEEQERLEMTLGMFAAVLAHPRAGQDGLGLAVQAYGSGRCR